MQWKKSKPFKKNKQVLAHTTNHFFSNHLNGKTRSKKINPSNVLTNKEDKTLVAWIWVCKNLDIPLPYNSSKQKC
jgi:hypothetical protein